MSTTTPRAPVRARQTAGQQAPGTVPGEVRDPAYEAYLEGLRAYDDEQLRRQRRPFEEHWNLHPVKPLEYYRWMEEERAYERGVAQRRAIAEATGRTTPSKPPAVLTFTAEFEVRK
jgi:hypothetical protein